MPQPTDVRDLQCFLGMINYLNKYSSQLAEFCNDLHEVAKKNSLFVWFSEHTEALEAIKQCTHPEVL